MKSSQGLEGMIMLEKTRPLRPLTHSHVQGVKILLLLLRSSSGFKRFCCW